MSSLISLEQYNYGPLSYGLRLVLEQGIIEAGAHILPGKLARIVSAQAVFFAAFPKNPSLLFGIYALGSHWPKQGLPFSLIIPGQI